MYLHQRKKNRDGNSCSNIPQQCVSSQTRRTPSQFGSNHCRSSSRRADNANHDPFRHNFIETIKQQVSSQRPRNLDQQQPCMKWLWFQIMRRYFTKSEQQHREYEIRSQER